MTLTIAGDDRGSSFAVYATPRATRTEIAGERDGALWARLAAPPVEGAANAALTELLARRLGVARGAVRVISGNASRHKRVAVAGLSPATVRARLALDGQP